MQCAKTLGIYQDFYGLQLGLGRIETYRSGVQPKTTKCHSTNLFFISMNFSPSLFDISLSFFLINISLFQKQKCCKYSLYFLSIFFRRVLEYYKRYKLCYITLHEHCAPKKIKQPNFNFFLFFQSHSYRDKIYS